MTNCEAMLPGEWLASAMAAWPPRTLTSFDAALALLLGRCPKRDSLAFVSMSQWLHAASSVRTL
jgi:hypothetical protein